MVTHNKVVCFLYRDSSENENIADISDRECARSTDLIPKSSIERKWRISTSCLFEYVNDVYIFQYIISGIFQLGYT